MVKNKKPYSERTDLEKIKSNWTKSRKLFERGEYSVSIIRAVTTIEIAANFAIRQELIVKHSLPDNFVDSLLLWANGVNGKFIKLLYEITEGHWNKTLRIIHKNIKFVNDHRNKIVHSGQFKKKPTAKKCLAISRKNILKLVNKYESGFKLPA